MVLRELTPTYQPHSWQSCSCTGWSSTLHWDTTPPAQHLHVCVQVPHLPPDHRAQLGFYVWQNTSQLQESVIPTPATHFPRNPTDCRFTQPAVFLPSKCKIPGLSLTCLFSSFVILPDFVLTTKIIKINFVFFSSTPINLLISTEPKNWIPADTDRDTPEQAWFSLSPYNLSFGQLSLIQWDTLDHPSCLFQLPVVQFPCTKALRHANMFTFTEQNHSTDTKNHTTSENTYFPKICTDRSLQFMSPLTNPNLYHYIVLQVPHSDNRKPTSDRR